MTTILCFGDSNTHGTVPMRERGVAARFEKSVRWPGRLQDILGKDTEVITEGLPGRTTLHNDPIDGAHLNGLTVLPALLASHAPLDLVIVKLGTNDLKARFAMTADDIARSLEVIARHISGCDCGPAGNAPEILMICPPPISETGCFAEILTGGGEKSRRLQDQFVTMCQQQNLEFIMAAECLQVSEIDGIHYTADAHMRLAEQIAAKVTSLLD